MDEKKENKTQAGLVSSADPDSVSDDQKSDPDSESLDETQKASEKETSHTALESSNDAHEERSESEITENDAEETDSFAASDSDDAHISNDDKAEPAEGGSEFRLSEEDSGHKGEDDNPTQIESEDISASADSETSSKEEDLNPDQAQLEKPEVDKTSKDQFEQQPGDAEVQTEDLSEIEAEVKPRKKIPLVKAALTTILVAAVFAGFFIFDNKSNINSAQKATSKKVENVVMPKANYRNTKPTIEPGDPNTIFNTKIKEISMLRETLLRKKEEIRQLKRHYQEGIEELEKEIFDEMRSTNTGTLSQVLENKGIAFKLRTIQRRHAYLQQLERPSQWIYKACEELLYLKRRAMVDLQVAEVASGIDMNVHMRHMNTALEKYSPTADRLAVDLTNVPLEPLANIWEQMQTRNLQTSTRHASSKNGVISEQVCSGVFKRVTELSEISVEAAKCIAEMPGSDLFLNDLSEIEPRAAKYLFQWKGSWLCLNGLKALSPRVANHLFQWDGGWISLNGLTEFPPEIGQILLQWPGKQLELMGLRYTNGSLKNIGIEYLVEWERSGGKVFVPKEVREKIDELKGDSA